jgi:surfeit locus 1 family protein
MSYLQFRGAAYRFRPSLIGTLIVLICIPLFIRFGFWQYDKAIRKQALQDQYEAALLAEPVALPESFDDVMAWRYRQVRVTGRYQPEYQILLDNQIAQEQVGYHVITPFRIGGTKRYVLVDRGWVPVGADRSQLPQIETPTGEQVVAGSLWLPPDKYYSLEASTELQAEQSWQTVWQNLDMRRYQEMVDIDVAPLVIRLAEDSEAGGFLRIWPRPDERIEMHLGYAWQWFGFAVAALLIWIVTAFRKKTDEQNADR